VQVLEVEQRLQYGWSDVATFQAMYFERGWEEDEVDEEV
jgi:hypothetical protein